MSSARDQTVGPYADAERARALRRRGRRGHLRVRERAGRGARSWRRARRRFAPAPSRSPSRRTGWPRRISSAGLGIPVAPYARVDRLEDLRAALSRIKPPALLKTRRFGYDGKGQAPIRTEDAAPAALEAIGNVPALLEGLVAVRARDLGDRRARPGRRARLLRSGRERAPERHPRHQPRARPHRPQHGGRGQRDRRQGRRRARPCRRALRRDVRARRREPSADRQRDRAARAQFRPLDASTPASSASSRTTCGRSPAGRSARPRATATR